MVTRLLAGATLLSLVLLGAAPAAIGREAPAAAAAPPVHTLTVSGTGLTMAPAYSPAIARYALRTTGASTGAVTVIATTSDPAGVVRVDGRPVASGAVTLTGVAPGEEISVMYDDAGGHAAHALVVLPPAFPALDGTGPAAGVAAGEVLLTMSSWNANPDRFHAVVDDWGVPRWFRREPSPSHDLRVQPNGSLTRSALVPGRPPEQGTDEIVEMNARFEEVARHRTVGLVNTDFHEALLLADGSKVLISYEWDPARFVTDSVIQEIDPDRDVVFQWSTEDHVVPRQEETVVDLDDPLERIDYAHINSVTITPDGDYLASFRGLSAIFKIARTAHDGYAEGEVIWRLGGRKSDFTFVGDPYDGPCAQHTATLLPNGHVMAFDNGSSETPTYTGFCVDPDDPSGPTHDREISRFVEWDLDFDPVTGTGTATMVRQHAPGHYAPFTGSVAPLTGGNVFIGWGASGFLVPPDPQVRATVASELDTAGNDVWELTTPTRQGSYRAYRQDVPDAFAPAVDVVAPVDGATYAQGQAVRADYGCTDIGGSTLDACTGSAPSAGLVDTSTPGTRTFELVALDGEGNRTVARRTYTVTPAPPAPPTPPTPPGPPAPASPRADLALKVGDRPFTGADVYPPDQQQRRARLPIDGRVRGTVRLESTGTQVSAFVLSGPIPKAVRVRWYRGGRDVTGQVRRGQLRAEALPPGDAIRLRLVVTANRRTDPGDRATIRITVRPPFGAAVTDAVTLKVRVPGG